MPAVKDFSVEEKLSSIVKLQKIESKLDNIQVLKGELYLTGFVHLLPGRKGMRVNKKQTD